MDLVRHEFEVINSFFTRGAAWVETENAAVSAKIQEIEFPDNDCVERLCCHPDGPVELEQIVCRATINELNALVEFAFQQALEKKKGSMFIESKGCCVVGANRDVLHRELLAYGVNLTEFPGYSEIIEIKELSEGFKHRQGLRPLPKLKKDQWQTPPSSFPVLDDEQFLKYEITLSDVSKYLNGVRGFLERCRSELII